MTSSARRISKNFYEGELMVAFNAAPDGKDEACKLVEYIGAGGGVLAPARLWV